MKFIIGLLIGIGLAGGVAFYLNKAQNPFVDKGLGLSNSSDPVTQIKNNLQPITLAPGTKMQQASSAPTANTKPAASTPAYDFYDVLQGKKDLSTKEVASAVTQERYMIQVGAFNDPDQANDMKARLALLGFNSKIRSQQNNQQIINRVLIGPFNDNGKAQDVLTQLKDQDINANIINLH